MPEVVGDRADGRSLRALLDLSRHEAAALGRETVAILAAGSYETAAGSRVDIGEQVAACVRGTVAYDLATPLHERSAARGETTVTVHNQTTLAAVCDLRSRGRRPAALNFASATNPGGGFLNGARAQEEYLCRSSALWACLRDQPMYEFHQARQDPFYSDFMLYSPDVPVIRDDHGELLAAPYPCSIITAAAVQAHAVGKYFGRRDGEIAAVMLRRIVKVLAVAETHGHDSLVLGAWGCGAFGNDGEVIAGLFRQALEERFCGAFAEVVFAVTDWSEDERFIGPFTRAFGGGEVTRIR